MNWARRHNLEAGTESRQFSREQMVVLARLMMREARFWARILAGHGSGESRCGESRIFLEVLAFSTRLVELRMPLAHCQAEVPYARLVQELWKQSSGVAAATDVGTAARPEQGMDPQAFSDDQEPPDLGYRVALYADTTHEQGPFTDEMFEEFCRATGLESRLLVGQGAHLAAIMFYFVIFGLLGFNFSAGQIPTRAERNRLLRDARHCRQQMECLLEQFLENPGGFRPVLAELRQVSRLALAQVPEPSGRWLENPPHV